MNYEIDAIYLHGVFVPLEALKLREGARVHLRVEVQDFSFKSQSATARIATPRLSHPAQATDFTMQVSEAADTGF